MRRPGPARLHRAAVAADRAGDGGVVLDGRARQHRVAAAAGGVRAGRRRRRPGIVAVVAAELPPPQSPRGVMREAGMTGRTISALLFGIAVLLGCGPTLQVKTDFDHTATFTHYRSFRMGEERVIERGTVTENTIVKDRIDAAIRNSLVTRGLMPEVV